MCIPLFVNVYLLNYFSCTSVCRQVLLHCYLYYIIYRFCAEDGHVKIVNCGSRKIEILIPSHNEVQPIGDDYVFNYSRNVLTLGLFTNVLHDMIRSKPSRLDAIAIFKVAFIYFKAGNLRLKYANELLRLLVHQLCVMTQNQAASEYDGLFVNTTGTIGRYIATDLQMEYIVKEVKKHIKHMHSGQTNNNIDIHCKALSGLQTLGDTFDNVAQVIVRCTKHCHVSNTSDVTYLVNTMVDLKLFKHIPGRMHASFPNLSSNLTDDINATKLHKWVYQRIQAYCRELGN